MSDAEFYDPLPVGEIWVCGACGKTSRTKSGQCRDGSNATNEGDWWDESCMLNAVRCYDKRNSDGTWQAVPGQPQPPTTEDLFERGEELP